MPMFILNQNTPPPIFNAPPSKASLGVAVASPKAPSALNAGMLARVHNVRPGCGSCGRH